MKTWIIIENGDLFEGTREQFMGCFFSNASDEQIKDWCLFYGWKLKINGNDIL